MCLASCETVSSGPQAAGHLQTLLPPSKGTKSLVFLPAEDEVMQFFMNARLLDNRLVKISRLHCTTLGVGLMISEIYFFLSQIDQIETVMCALHGTEVTRVTTSFHHSSL